MSKAAIKSSLILSLSLGAALTAQSALAYEGGDIIIRSGIVQVSPDESSTDISIDSPALGSASGAQVGLNNEKQLGLTASYMFSDKFGIELLAATPFSHDILASGDLAGLGKLGKTKHLPPTLSAHYYPLSATSKFQPYIGVGLNYTTFFDTSASSLLNSASIIDALANMTPGAPGAGAINSASNTDIELDDSFGLSFQLGLDYELTDNLSLNASYWLIDIDTEAKITSDTNLGKVTATVDVDVDPSVYMLGLAYKF